MNKRVIFDGTASLFAILQKDQTGKALSHCENEENQKVISQLMRNIKWMRSVV